MHRDAHDPTRLLVHPCPQLAATHPYSPAGALLHSLTGFDGGGGFGYGNTFTSFQTAPQIYNPLLPIGQRWSGLLTDSGIQRGYHNSAVLIASGEVSSMLACARVGRIPSVNARPEVVLLRQVMVAGSETTGEYRVQYYVPSYLLNGLPRPLITTAPCSLAYNTQFGVTYYIPPPGGTIAQCAALSYLRDASVSVCMQGRPRFWMAGHWALPVLEMVHGHCEQAQGDHQRMHRCLGNDCSVAACRVVLIRSSSSTHSNQMDQRMIVLGTTVGRAALFRCRKGCMLLAAAACWRQGLIRADLLCTAGHKQRTADGPLAPRCHCRAAGLLYDVPCLSGRRALRGHICAADSRRPGQQCHGGGPRAAPGRRAVQP